MTLNTMRVAAEPLAKSGVFDDRKLIPLFKGSEVGLD
jgi:hypothetical protein